MKKINTIQNLIPTYMTFFCGTGGSSAGFKQAGYKEVFANDLGELQEKCFTQNFPDVPFKRDDIRNLNFENIRREILKQSAKKLKVNLYDIDVMSFSSPCQNFSRSNTKRKPFAFTNLLFMECLRLINEFQPKVALVENVPGMLDKKMRPMLCKILSQLEQLTNYNFEYRILNSVHYGVPQSRDRIIFMIVRKDVGLPSFPAPQKVDAQKVALNNLFPSIEYYSSGQFENKLVPASKAMATLTAAGGEWVYEKGIKRKLTNEELKVLASMEDFNFENFTPGQVRFLVGNAVMPRFMKAIAENIKTNILKVN